MKAVSSRELGSKARLKGNLSARNITERRTNGGSRPQLPTNGRNKPVPPMRAKIGLRVPPGKNPASGNDYREAPRLDRRRLLRPMERALARRPMQGSFNRYPRVPQGSRKPHVPRPAPGERARKFRERLGPMPGHSDPPQSTKDALFQGPQKARSYREEDLKKFKVDIRPSRSPERKSELYNRAELRKFKIDIKGEMSDYPRRRDEASVAYSKQDLEKVKVHIHRTDMQGQNESHPTHNLRRDVDLSDFHVPRKHDVKLFNSRNTFSSPRSQQQKDMRMQVHIDRPNIENPNFDAPVRRNVDMNSFRMPRRSDVSPPRVNRKVIPLERQNHEPRQHRDNFDMMPPKYQQPWAGEGERPVFCNRNVVPNLVRLADIFPSESEKLTKTQQGHSHPASTHPPRNRSYERERDYYDHKRNPPSSQHASGDYRSRALPPIPAEDKHRPPSDPHRSPSDLRRSNEKPRDRYDVGRKDPLGYDAYKSSTERMQRRSRSRSPIRRPASPSLCPPPPPRTNYKPAPYDDKYRGTDDKYRDDKSRGTDDKYRGTDDKYRDDKSRGTDDKYRDDKYRGTDDKYRDDKARGTDDKYRDDKYRGTDDKYRDDKYRGTDDKYRSTDDKYRSADAKYHSTDDKYRSTDDKYRSTDDKYRSVDDKYREEKYRNTERSYNDKDRSSNDKPGPYEDRYRSGHDKPSTYDDKYRNDKPYDDKYRNDKPYDDKYRDKTIPVDDKYRSVQRSAQYEDKYRSTLDKPYEDKYRSSSSLGDKYRSETGRVNSSSYDTTRRGYEPYPSTSRGYSPSRGRDRRREGELDTRRGDSLRVDVPPPHHSSFSLDHKRRDNYYSKEWGGGDSRVGGEGGGLMPHTIPVLQHPPVFSTPFMRPLPPPGPPHLFRPPRGPLFPVMLIPFPPRPFRFLRPHLRGPFRPALQNSNKSSEKCKKSDH